MNDGWITEGVAAVTAEPARIAELFPAAGRAVGRTTGDRQDDSYAGTASGGIAPVPRRR